MNANHISSCYIVIFLSDENIEKIFNKNVFVFVETWNHDNTNVTIKVYKPVHIIKK